MRIDAIILARGGSKGIPGKNHRTILGKPLISWTIEHALNIDIIDDIVVTTDGEDFIGICYDDGMIDTLLIAEDKFKSYGELKAKLNRVLGIGIDDEEVVARTIVEDDEPDIPSQASEESTETLSYFQKLANEEY